MNNISYQGNNHKVAGTQEMKTFEFTVRATAITKVYARSEKEAWSKFKRQSPGAAINKAHISAIGTKEEDVFFVNETV